MTQRTHKKLRRDPTYLVGAKTDADGVWLPPKTAYRYSGRPQATLWLWTQEPGCPLLGEVLLRRPFREGTGREWLYYSKEQLDRLAEAEAAATPGDDDKWTTRAKAVRRFGVNRVTLTMLTKTGQVKTHEVSGVDSRRRGVKRLLVSVADLQDYVGRRSPNAEPIDGLVAVKEAARLLGKAEGSVCMLIKRRKWPIFRGPHGTRRGRTDAIFVRRADVEREALAAAAPNAHSSAHVDENGWRWLPLEMADEVFGFRRNVVRYHAHECSSSWALDGRESWAGCPMPEEGRRRRLLSKKEPNHGRGVGGRGHAWLWYYLEEDCRILADRMAGLLTAGQAAERAGAIRDKLARGAGPDGMSRPRPAVARTAPSPAGDGRSSNGTAGAAESAAQPRWDETTATLYFGESVVRRFRGHPAQNQRELIEAFHRAAWARTIPDPFRDARKLNLTIYQLNRSLDVKAIRFRGDGTGEGVTWEPAS